MISVIVPVYKVEKYLRKCVRSIQQQTYTDLEIILVDDGSPDRCGEICDELAAIDKRIKVIHKKNGGLSSARNAGIEYVLSSSMEIENHFVAFVDSDDYIETTMYENMMGLMTDDCDLVMCGYRVVYDGDDNFTSCGEYVIDELDNNQVWENVFGKLNNAVWNKLYRMSKIENIRFYEDLIHGEDLIFNMDYIASCKKAKITSAQYYTYLKRKGSITSKGFTPNKLKEIEVKDKAKEIVKHSKPQLLTTAEKYCFRARMNVIRAIYKAHFEKEYRENLEAYSDYVSNHYKLVKDEIRLKEKIEYFTYINFHLIYIFIIRRMG